MIHQAGINTLILLWLALAGHTGVEAYGSEDISDRTVVLAVASAESYESGLPVLRYPELDLQRFSEAMTNMAGVPAGRILAVKDGSLEQLRAGFQKAARLIRELRPSGPKSKFIFYYSGHADSKGLHLSDGMLLRDEFHKLIGQVDADTKVALLDSCYSGALAAKGVKAAGEFAIPKAQFDEPSGAVFLAATSASDQAFEIDELKGSLFTHHLIGGLYGLADFNQDGLITIEELYQHVYKQVNLNTLGLPDSLQQKPEYASRLSGRGALVMSFVRKKTSEIRIDQDLAGEITFSAKRGVQIFRIFKSAGELKSVRLMPGNYDVIIRDGDRVGQAELAVLSDQSAQLVSKDVIFRNVPNMKSVAKGARSDHFWGVRAATHVGSIWEIAPHVEGTWTSGGVRLPFGTWRFTSALGAHQNQLKYDRPGSRTQDGSSSTMSVILGAAGDFELYELFNGLSLTSVAGAGSDYISYRWSDPQDSDRTFDPVMPKVVLGVGTAYLLHSGRTLEFSFRREWLFGTEKNSGDVLSFSASLFLIGYQF